VLCALTEHDLFDAFASCTAMACRDASWFFRRRGKTTGRRFDHVFASRCLNATACEYEHQFREDGLSDHSAIEAPLQPSGGAGA
jgi:endonuclease/exonuclease/phosphatase family metal-dependent hydrolase